MERKSVDEMAKTFEKMTRNSTLCQKDKKDVKKETGKVFRNKLSFVESAASALDELENNYILLDDDFEDFHIPLNDDLTSSSDDSEFEFFNYREHRKTLTSLAQAVRLEFLQNMPAQNKQTKPHSTSLLKTLNTYMSLSKSWQNETDSTAFNSCYLHSSSVKKPEQVAFHYPVGEKEDVLRAMNMFNPSYEVISEESEPPTKMETKKEASSSSVFKKIVIQETSELQSVTNTETLRSKNDYKDHIPTMVRTSEPPRNALVLYWGRISMTTKELRNKNLTRCIKTLLEEDHYEFVLLKIQERKLLLQYCNTSKNDALEETAPKNKRKKSITDVFRSSGRDLLKKQRDDGVQLLQERRSSRSNIFACIGLAGSGSRSHQSLQHNDSLSLKSYQIMKRKKQLEFDYKKIVYCGVEERNIPNNMLVWIYHTEYGNYCTVECHCVECDDQSHARQLSRALKHEIARLSNNCASA